MTPRSATEGTHELRVALERTATAMGQARLDDLLAAGEALELALTRLPHGMATSTEDADRLRAEIDAARAALLRCRRLGVSLTSFVRATLDTHGVGSTYDAAPAAASALAGRGVNTSA
jgi:hypothetical protein